jgi:uncharacterized protein
MQVLNDRRSRWILSIALTLAFFTLPAGVQTAPALDVPPLKGRVNDLANMIHPTMSHQLESALAQLEKTDSTQIVVLTIASLEGQILEEFSLAVVERWRIGQKNVDNGVLLLVVKKERKIRIEVGYGLEGKLTDLVAGRIIRNIMTPRFKMGRFDQGIVEGVSAIIGVVRGEFTAPTPGRRSGDFPRTSPGLIGIIAFFFLINMLGRVNRFIGAAAGGIMAPIAGILLFGTGIVTTALLIPIGIAGGFLTGLFGGPLSFGHMTHHRGGMGRGGGFGGFGGFGGGGGGFGGGGASGGW